MLIRVVLEEVEEGRKGAGWKGMVEGKGGGGKRIIHAEPFRHNFLLA